MPEPSAHGSITPREGALRARPQDLERLRELCGEARSSVADVRGGRLLLDEPLSARAVVTPDELGLGDERALLLGGWYENLLVGVAAAEIGDSASRDVSIPGRATLALLYVEPAARGVGVGESLLAAVVAWCVEQGCDGLDVTALPGDRATKSLLERLGFTARKVVMHRSLDVSLDLRAVGTAERP